MPSRAHRFALVAHCHLNTNTKVHGLAGQPAMQSGLVRDLAARDVGIIQLPCPEVTYLGMCRWGMTYEQYDTPAYRRHCRSVLVPVVDTVTALIADGATLTGIWGADGSPSCAVTETCTGYPGGELEGPHTPATPPAAMRFPGRGVFFEELGALLDAAGVDAAWFGLDERAGEGTAGLSMM